MNDTRIVYGARCVWWGSIADVNTTPSGIPCCPNCGSVLMEVPDEATWWDGVDRHEADGTPGYRSFIEWLRGRCYPDMPSALDAFGRSRT